MTPMRQDLAARRRGELARDRGSRRVSSAIDARRRLNTRRADGTRTKAHPIRPSDPRTAYLRRSYDSPAGGAFRVSGAQDPSADEPSELPSSVLAAREAKFVLRPLGRATHRRELA